MSVRGSTDNERTHRVLDCRFESEVRHHGIRSPRKLAQVSTRKSEKQRNAVPAVMSEIDAQWCVVSGGVDETRYSDSL